MRLTEWRGEHAAIAYHRENYIDKLAAYEDAEEQGRLVILPCKVGSHVYRVWITDGRNPEITEHDMSDLLHIVRWMDKFGKTVFLSHEEAEAALKEKRDDGTAQA